MEEDVFGGEGKIPDDSFIYQGSYVLGKIKINLGSCSFGPENSIANVKKWLRAGPRKHLYFEPSQVKAVIVTCGGLCPGLNNVIKEIVFTLKNNYGISEVYGIQYGYKGKI